MKKWRLILSLISITGLIGCTIVLALNSLVVDDYYLLRQRDTETEVAVAFTVALRKNHPSAYQMIDPLLIPRLDKWMETHQEPKCVRRDNDVLAGGVNGITVFYSCDTETNDWYQLSVYNIIIEDMKITNWGEIREDND